MNVDTTELDLLAETLRKTMTELSGPGLDEVLTELGWRELLAEEGEIAIATVFRLLGETGAHAALLNDVVLTAAGHDIGGTVALPYAGGRWVVWQRTDHPGGTLDSDLPLSQVDEGEAMPLAAGRRALGWWLVGTSRAMLELARTHALHRVQFGKPVASFQAIRHRLAETLVAIEGAEATLLTAGADTTDEELSSLLAKAAAGEAALTTARHCQQVLGGMGFTSEHGLHHHIRRTLVLDGLLGSTHELTRTAGKTLRTRRTTPRLATL